MKKTEDELTSTSATAPEPKSASPGAASARASMDKNDAAGASTEDGASTTGVVTETSTRLDGSIRPTVRVRTGHMPPDEQPRYEFPRPLRERGVLLQWTHGYGFIKPDKLGDNLFVHHTGVRSERARELQGGEHVEFEREPPRDGETLDRANNVRLVDELPMADALTPAPARATATVDAAKAKATLVPRAVAARKKRLAVEAPSGGGSPSDKASRARRKLKQELPAEAAVLGYWGFSR